MKPSIRSRAHAAHPFADDVCRGLLKEGQKELPSKYLYDALGSALFEAITLLPEYGVARADTRILERHAHDIASHICPGTLVAELGSGSGRKTRWLLQALRRHGPLSYYPIEISSAALAACEAELRDIESVSIVGVESEYLEGLAEVTTRRHASTPMLVLFLGSTIGNFDASADVRFLRELRRLLRPGDALLLGTDLLKPVPALIEAYDDPLGVTAAFNLNLLGRINRELGGDFDLHRFEHVARFNLHTTSVEMHLRARETQKVHIALCGLSIEIAQGETIWTETSRKYTPEAILTLADNAGFAIRAQWTDAEWAFTNSLMTRTLSLDG